MTVEEFRNIAQGIQAILLSLAALGGGAWALMKFGITGERIRAKICTEPTLLCWAGQHN